MLASETAPPTAVSTGTQNALLALGELRAVAAIEPGAVAPELSASRRMRITCSSEKRFFICKVSLVGITMRTHHLDPYKNRF